MDALCDSGGLLEDFHGDGGPRSFKSKLPQSIAVAFNDCVSMGIADLWELEKEWVNQTPGVVPNVVVQPFLVMRSDPIGVTTERAETDVNAGVVDDIQSFVVQLDSEGEQTNVNVRRINIGETKIGFNLCTNQASRTTLMMRPFLPCQERTVNSHARD
jgi:hypothetical protein